MNTRFNYRRLDAQARTLMLEEIKGAEARGDLYFSTRFTAAGAQAWPALLAEAAQTYDEHWLAYQLELRGHMKHLELKAKPSGGYTTEVDPKNWTGRIDNPTIENRSPCPRNDGSIIPSSKPK